MEQHIANSSAQKIVLRDFDGHRSTLVHIFFEQATEVRVVLFIIIIVYVSLLCVYCACVFIYVGVYNCMMYENNPFVTVS